jgi:hypothetical protein
MRKILLHIFIFIQNIWTHFEGYFPFSLEGSLKTQEKETEVLIQTCHLDKLFPRNIWCNFI